MGLGTVGGPVIAMTNTERDIGRLEEVAESLKEQVRLPVRFTAVSGPSFGYILYGKRA